MVKRTKQEASSPHVVAGPSDGGRGLATVTEIEGLRREWARHEGVMRAIADARSAEGSVAKRAFQRISDITTELGLDPAIIELAHQVCHLH